MKVTSSLSPTYLPMLSAPIKIKGLFLTEIGKCMTRTIEQSDPTNTSDFISSIIKLFGSISCDLDRAVNMISNISKSLDNILSSDPSVIFNHIVNQTTSIYQDDLELMDKSNYYEIYDDVLSIKLSYGRRIIVAKFNGKYKAIIAR